MTSHNRVQLHISVPSFAHVLSEDVEPIANSALVEY